MNKLSFHDRYFHHYMSICSIIGAIIYYVYKYKNSPKNINQHGQLSTILQNIFTGAGIGLIGAIINIILIPVYIVATPLLIVVMPRVIVKYVIKLTKLRKKYPFVYINNTAQNNITITRIDVPNKYLNGKHLDGKYDHCFKIIDQSSDVNCKYKYLSNRDTNTYYRYDYNLKRKTRYRCWNHIICDSDICILVRNYRNDENKYYTIIGIYRANNIILHYDIIYFIKQILVDLYLTMSAVPSLL